MSTPAPPTAAFNRRHLNVQDLRRLRHLGFSSRRAVEGQYAGRHVSPQRGHSVEFKDYREYVPGDEIGYIDWKVFGRSDRWYVKLFEHQSDMTVNILVDASASMHYPSPDAPSRSRLSALPDTKYDHACRMAAAIAFLVTQQQDRVSFGLAHTGLRDFLRPSGSFNQLATILTTMEQTTPTGEAHLADALTAMSRLVPRRGVLVLFSDLLEDVDATLEALSIWTHRGSDAIVFHTLHADELTLPAWHEATFIDSESGGQVKLNVADVRNAYDQRMRAFLDQCATWCRARRVDYNLVSTATPYHKALEHYLFTRAAMT